MAGSTCCDESLTSVISLTVIAFNNTPTDGTLQVHFDELGGTIGRADSNHLMLPDPERMISRVAAQVVFRNGSFAIVDRGSNPINLNGRDLGSGREAPLAAGDRLRIGGYELSVRLGKASATAAGDPFSDLVGPAAATPTPRAQLVDPLLKTGAGVAAAPLAAGVAAPTGGIPTDWDPFAPSVRPDKGDGQAAPQRNALGLELGASAPAALVPDLAASAAAPSSLDQLFGLPRSSGGDPLANSVLDAPMAQPNMAADADPMRALKSAPQASAATEPDHLPDLQRAFIPPTIIELVKSAPAPVAGAVLSWDADSSAARAVIRAAAVLPAPAPATTPAPPAHATYAAPAAASAALLAAFRRGLNAPALDMPVLTPELMELIGQLLHEAARGTVDLLGARATVKRELRAQGTNIVPSDNNPLKFSPNAEVALQHMLTPATRGFVAAAPAMRDAYDDLRAHQFGVVAGMQAALEAVLQRFDPAALDEQLGVPSLLQRLLPSGRKAQLWEGFTKHYARVRDDANDDFHTLFGDAFLSAYDENVQRFASRQAADDSGGRR